MTNIELRRNADGSHGLVLRDERAEDDHALFRPIIENLQRAIEILGGSPEPELVIDDVMELIRYASRALSAIEPTVEGAARDEARKVLSAAIKDLRNVQQIYQRGGGPDRAEAGGPAL
jgi:hypothetical protein